MSYDNAEPKVLKTLNSSGQVLDDAGNVINDTSDYWVQLYNQTEPKVDKILKSDGTVVDAAGNLIQDTTEFNVKKYNQAEPIPAKYLHADGTVDENPGSGGADLEDNHQTTIDVSTYTEPVEITPTSGKDGMKKATVTLSNIPSGGLTAYAWDIKDAEYPAPRYFNFSNAPVNTDNFKVLNNVFPPPSSPPTTIMIATFAQTFMDSTYTRVSDTEFILNEGTEAEITYVRTPINDVTIW